MSDDLDPTPLGLLRCLQVLAEEAASLRLTGTMALLQQAVETCRAEAGIGRGPVLPRWGLASLN